MKKTGLYDGAGSEVEWITTENGEHVPVEEGQTKAEAIKEHFDKQGQSDSSQKMTPAEKIASVKIDFSKDNILPELNEEDLALINAKKNKPVLLKKGIINRNFEEHSDVSDTDFQSIVTQALYEPTDIFAANIDKKYFHFVKLITQNSKGHPKIGLLLLDVEDKKDNFEIVHAHFVSEDGLKRAKKKTDMGGRA